MSSVQRGLQRGGDGSAAALQSLISQRLHRTVAGAGVFGLREASCCHERAVEVEGGSGAASSASHLSLFPAA